MKTVKSVEGILKLVERLEERELEAAVLVVRISEEGKSEEGLLS